MSPSLRPLQLPLLVERRRKQEEEAMTVVTAFDLNDGDVIPPQHRYSWQYSHSRRHPLPMTDSISDMMSPATPVFSPRSNPRYSSSVSSFDLALPTSCDDIPSPPTQPMQSPAKSTLDDVKEEPFEYDRFSFVRSVEAYDDVSEHLDLYDCLCDEPCIHRDSNTTNYYGRGRNMDPNRCMSDGDSASSLRSSGLKQRNGSLPPFMGFSHRMGSRFPSLSRWRSPRKTSGVGSPVSDVASERRSLSRRSLSRAASSRSSSVSRRSNRFLTDRSVEPAFPPTPALSFFESSDSITMSRSPDAEQADPMLSLQRERRQATTPLLPPMMDGHYPEYVTAQPSPLQSPTVASPFDDQPQSPLLSPPLSTRPSISSFRQMMAHTEVPAFPEPDAWSDRLGHANFTILPAPYAPTEATLVSLGEYRADWEAARVNYTKHLVRTGEHYGLTSKTYGYTEAKWAEIDGNWREIHDEIVEAVLATGEAAVCAKFDDSVLTTIPIIDGEGKFPERGDEDIVGPMVREATMTSPTGSERRRPGFWRSFTDRVGLRK